MIQEDCCVLEDEQIAVQFLHSVQLKEAADVEVFSPSLLSCAACMHKCVGKCTYIPTPKSVPIVVAVVTVTFFSQAEKEPISRKPSERMADIRNHSITTNISTVRIATVGMILIIRLPLFSCETYNTCHTE